jgi:glycosyltransferase involved in cell wall biosynthesis
MRVAFIDPSLFTAPYDLALMDGIAAAQSNVAMRLYTRQLNEGDVESERMVEHFYHAAWLGNGRLAKGVQHPFDLARLCRELEGWQPDIIHLQWAVLPPVDLWFLPRLRRIAPLVLTLHDSLPHNGSPRSRLQVWGNQALVRGVDAIIVHTAQARARLEAAGIAPGRIVHLPHGLLNDHPAASMPVARDSGPVQFVLFGKLKPYKGADILVRAVARLAPALRAQCRVHIVGWPYMETDSLLNLAATLGAAGDIAFEFGYVPERRVATMFSGNCVAVFPYREIDSSGVLMTAIAASCPIVASRLGGFAELLDERNALLFRPGDDADLAAALSRVIEEPGLLQSLADGARALRATIPTWHEIGRGTLALYQAVIAGRPAWHAPQITPSHTPV